MGHCHDEGCRYAFSAHVADTEEQFILADIEIKQVTAHFFGREHHAVGIQVREIRERREPGRQHRHLDITGDIEFALHTLVLLGGADELSVAAAGIPDDENEQCQTQ